MSESTISPSTSFWHAASRCFAWSFGIFAGLIFLYHYGLSIAMFGCGMVAAWWNYMHQFGPFQWYVFGGLIATASTLYCLGSKFPLYAVSMRPKVRPFFCWTLMIFYVLTYIHIGVTAPDWSPKWNTLIAALMLIFLFVGLFSMVCLYDDTVETMKKMHHKEQTPNDDPGNGSSSTQTPPKTPTFIELDETWEQRFARQAAERRRNAQKH